MIHWYAIQSKSQKEELLCAQLRLREVDVFSPQMRVQPANPRARKVKPYFPGYVFGYVDLERVGISFLEWIPGAVGIVSFGGEPAPVSDHLIINLRQHLERINAAMIEQSKGFQPGDLVDVHWGPFAGYEAVFDTRLSGHDRVRVLLKMLESRQIQVELPVEQITLKKRFSTLAVQVD